MSTYLETKSFKSVQAKYRRKFDFNKIPQKSQIYRWVTKFEAKGTVNKLSKKITTRTGPKIKVRTEQNLNAVRESVERSQKKSIRRRYNEVLMKCYTRLRSRSGINEEIQWFQQDGSTPHTANFATQWFDERFP